MDDLTGEVPGLRGGEKADGGSDMRRWPLRTLLRDLSHRFGVEDRP